MSWPYYDICEGAFMYLRDLFIPSKKPRKSLLSQVPVYLCPLLGSIYNGRDTPWPSDSIWLPSPNTDQRPQNLQISPHTSFQWNRSGNTWGLMHRNLVQFPGSPLHYCIELWLASDVTQRLYSLQITHKQHLLLSPSAPEMKHPSTYPYLPLKNSKV